MIIFLFAETSEGVIGKNNKLPWSIPSEMNHFKMTTIGHDILMGSNTFESMDRKPLNDRLNIVITSNPMKYNDIKSENLIVSDNLLEIIKPYENSDKELFVIGGSSIFKQLDNKADKIIRTIIKKPYKGDVYMPKINYNKYVLKNLDTNNEYDIEYYERRGN